MSDDAHDPHGDLASGLAARWDAQDRQGEAALRRRRLKANAGQPSAISPEMQARARLKARLLTVDFLEAFPWRFSKKQIRALEEFATKRIAEALDAERQQQRVELRQAVVDMHVVIAGGTDGEDLHHWQGFNEAVEVVVAALDAAVLGV